MENKEDVNCSYWDGKDEQWEDDTVKSLLSILPAQLINPRDLRETLSHLPLDLLISTLKTIENEEVYWELAWAAGRKYVVDVYKEAEKLSRSLNLMERRLGANLIGTIFEHSQMVMDKATKQIIEIMDTEQDPDVLIAAIDAAGKKYLPELTDKIASFKSHPDADIRWTVAEALSIYENEPVAGDALVELAHDSDYEVRNYAVFVLGSLGCNGTPDSIAIRKTLWECTDDDDREIRAMALAGLAYRGEKDIVTRLVNELNEEDIYDDILRAAEEVANPVLYPRLVELRELFEEPNPFLDSAIEACKLE